MTNVCDHFVRTNTIDADAGRAYGRCETCGARVRITEQTRMGWPTRVIDGGDDQ